jgi:hypothetical protein
VLSGLAVREELWRQSLLGNGNGQLDTGFLFDLFFNHEDRGHMFLQNNDWLSVDYTALHQEDSILHNQILKSICLNLLTISIELSLKHGSY